MDRVLGDAVGFIGLLAFVVAPLLKRDRIARFWAAGMLFATIPVLRHAADGPALDVCRCGGVWAACAILGVRARPAGRALRRTAGGEFQRGG